MTFSSLEFLIFFVFVLAVDWLVLARFDGAAGLKCRHLFLLAASCYFYMSWNSKLILLLLLSTLIDYVCGARIHATASPFKRKALLAVCMTSNLGILGIFKYTNFFLENVNAVVNLFGGSSHLAIDLILPVGISFYIFHSMSYTIDIYRGHVEPCRSYPDFVLFVTFFPQLVAGPINRAHLFLPQLARRLKWTDLNLRRGVNYILMGLTKKLLLSDWLSTLADPVFANPAAYNPAAVWAGVVAYAIQIYCDFSGYSDMAIGLAALLGFDLMENFNMPYISKNVSEFWSRWHISLSTWLRDYLYLPLGGNRGGWAKTCRNLFIVMFLGGLWHGARWTFVAWGVAHGLALIAHKQYRRLVPLEPRETRRLPWLGEALGWVTTMTFVCFTWVLFRSQSFDTVRVMFSKMLLWRTDGAPIPYTLFATCLLVVVAANILGVMRFSPFRRFDQPMARPWIESLGYASILFLLLLLAPSETEPFIYFQF